MGNIIYRFYIESMKEGLLITEKTENTMTTTSTTLAGPNLHVMECVNRGNSVVFFDITMGDGEHKTELGRIRMELFVNDCPKTCENFRQFCTGEHIGSDSQPIGYMNCPFHRVIRDFMIQGGDILHHDGTGKFSIYNGTSFADENFIYKHDSPGLLSMANSGKNTNASQFFITCKKCEWLDNKHVVFGRILDDGESMMTVRKCEAVPTTDKGIPRFPLKISQCGEL